MHGSFTISRVGLAHCLQPFLRIRGNGLASLPRCLASCVLTPLRYGRYPQEHHRLEMLQFWVLFNGPGWCWTKLPNLGQFMADSVSTWVWCLRRFVDDCVAYLAGLVSTAEVLPVVRAQRDRMLTRVAIGALQQSLDALGVRDFSKAMQVCLLYRSPATQACSLAVSQGRKPDVYIASSACNSP